LIVVDWEEGPLVEYLRASARRMRLIEGSRSSVGVGVCSIGGVLRGNSLFSADGAAVGIMWVVWSSRELCATCWSVGKLLLVILLLLQSPTSSCVNCLGVVCSPLYSWCVCVCGLLSRIKWLAVCLLVCFVGRPAARGRGLYALSGRSRSGKAADSFATDDDFFAV
jgi:hypothetical protein